jgi:monoamine oxidase
MDNPNMTQFYFSETDPHKHSDIDYWKQQVYEVVRGVIPTIQLQDIADVQVSNWHLDPDILGSYSAPLLHSSNDDRRTLAETVGRLLFAGERTHYEGRYQSIDGAYESSVRAAREILQSTIPWYDNLF